MTNPIISARLDRNKRRILCGWPPGTPRCSGFFGLARRADTAVPREDDDPEGSPFFDPHMERLVRIRDSRPTDECFYIGPDHIPWVLSLDVTFVYDETDRVYRMGRHARSRYLAGLRPRNRRGFDVRDWCARHAARIGTRQPATGWYPLRHEWCAGFFAECPRCGRVNLLHPTWLFDAPVFEPVREPGPSGPIVGWRQLLASLGKALLEET